MTTPNEEYLQGLLGEVADGRVSPSDAFEQLRRLPGEDIGVARLDAHRRQRSGLPEVVFGSGKSPEQVAAIVDRMRGHGTPVLVTRLSPEAHAACGEALDAGKGGPGRYDPVSRTWLWNDGPIEITGEGTIVVACAGTSDLPVAEEAAITAEAFGNRVERVVDVGVAGIHRTFSSLDTLRSARVLVVVAGMEGALPSVVAGLVSCPVIAVPTSVGYGASFGGLAALLGMLNSCAPGVSVVNIDNGFGGACAASLINHPVGGSVEESSEETP
ncbi:MAG: nickel pincer cofactor biosynthesis protein LarB [Acidobacteriota bacterium]